MWLFGGGGVNTLGKSFLSSEEIPKCNLTHENTNTTLVPMDIRKIKSSSVVVADWGKGDTEFLLICLPCHWIISLIQQQFNIFLVQSFTSNVQTLLSVHLWSLMSSRALAFLVPPYMCRQHYWIPPVHCVLHSASCFFALLLTRYRQTSLSGPERDTKLVWLG